MTSVRVGTRGSALALTQTKQVVAALTAQHPDHRFETVTIETSGDRWASVPTARGGQKAIYVKELEEALLSGAIDMAVHSAKDLPARLPPSLVIGAWCRRADPRDVLVLRAGSEGMVRGLDVDADELLRREPGRVVRLATGSGRRRAFIKYRHPEVRVEPIRGNVDTRLEQLDGGAADALILAAAGLQRLGRSERIAAAFDPERQVPAPGQGALAVEIRQGRAAIASLLAPVADGLTAAAVTAERSVAAALDGDCRLPLGAYAWQEEGRLHLIAAIGEPDGARLVTARTRGTAAEARELGERVAEDLLRQGGDRLLALARDREPGS